MKRFVFGVLILLLAAESFAVEIYRPENYGTLNTIPCLVEVTDLDGNDASDHIRHISYNWYYEIPVPNWSRQPKYLNTYFNGCFLGGVVVHLLMEPGVYLISVRTPVDMQRGYKSAGEEGDWTSNTFKYDTTNHPRVIFVSPVANENGFFCGEWHIDYRAPKFYKYTKPVQN